MTHIINRCSEINGVRLRHLRLVKTSTSLWYLIGFLKFPIKPTMYRKALDSNTIVEEKIQEALKQVKFSHFNIKLLTCLIIVIFFLINPNAK